MSPNPRPSLKVALGQINPTAGALSANAAKIINVCQNAARSGARLAVFPELVLSGYPPRDLLDRPDFVQEQMQLLQMIARTIPHTLYAIIGCATPRNDDPRTPLHNTAVVLYGGTIVAQVHKQLLPNYDVFDESRYFEAGTTSQLVTIDSFKIGITICEDIWSSRSRLSERDYGKDPASELVKQGADLLVNISASPFNYAKYQTRRQALSNLALHYERPLIYVNQVGGQDELIYDGMSCIINREGRVVASATTFSEDVVVYDLDIASTTNKDSLLPSATREAVIWNALVLGTRDYVQKSGFSKVAIGLSGGIDSALSAAIAVEALEAPNVLGVFMPTRYTSDESTRDARTLAENLGIDLLECPIDSIFATYQAELMPWLDEIGGPSSNDVTFENVQSRIRGQVLMAIANRDGRLVLTTGNKSEIATGYCTLYGDTAGALGVLADVYKTEVYRLAHFVNEKGGAEIIPKYTITRAPSAELKHNQRDQDTLPAYDILDDILERYIEKRESAESMVKAGLPADAIKDVLQRLVVNEHKRKQLPPGLIVSSKAFGFSRRMPLTSRWR